MSAKSSLVTLPQVVCVQRMANQKKVGKVRFQKAMDDGRISRFLDSLNLDFNALPLPAGVSTHVVSVKVKLDWDWKVAVAAAGPQTPKTDETVWEVSQFFPPIGKKVVEEEILLLQDPGGSSGYVGLGRTLDWAQGVGLADVDPRTVFAIAAQHPTLHMQLDLVDLILVSTQPKRLQSSTTACCVEWDRSERSVKLLWLPGSFKYDLQNYWYAFRRPWL